MSKASKVGKNVKDSLVREVSVHVNRNTDPLASSYHLITDEDHFITCECSILKVTRDHQHWLSHCVAASPGVSPRGWLGPM